MVQVEGTGKVPPSPHELILQGGELRLLMAEAKRRESFRGYGGRSDTWGRGLTGAVVLADIGSIDSATSPILAGLVGEYSTATLFKRRGISAAVDLVLRKEGDGGKDFVINGVRLDVKTRTKDYGTFLIRHASENGRLLEQTADAFVFATWKLSRVVQVHGFYWRCDLRQDQVHDARVGSHTNYEIQPAELLPMSRLIDHIRSRESWR